MSEEELKTLKDYEFGGFDGVMLREEAKKWITQIQAKMKEKEGQFDDLGTDLGMEYAEAGEAIIGFIKHFFNLVEEK